MAPLNQIWSIPNDHLDTERSHRGRQGTRSLCLREKGLRTHREKHAISINVSRPLAGNPTRIFWYAKHDDLQAYERDHRAINTDGEFLQMLGEHSHCFIAGTTHDEILQTI